MHAQAIPTAQNLRAEGIAVLVMLLATLNTQASIYHLPSPECTGSRQM